MTRRLMMTIALFTFSIQFAAHGMGADSKNRIVAKKCHEFRDAVREGDANKINSFYSKLFISGRNSDESEPNFLIQKPRLLTKIFISEKYHPRDSVFLARAQFRVIEGANGDMVCLVSKNGEDENPELHTVRSIRLVEEDSDWKVNELKIHQGW